VNFDKQKAQFAAEGYAVFDRVVSEDMLNMLREQCSMFIAREDSRMDALGVDSIGITHRGRRYFANRCQRTQPALRKFLLGDLMAGICKATLGNEAYFFFDQFVVKGPEGGLPFGWHQDSGYVVGNGGPSDHRPYLTCWCPLDDATVENGTVRLLPFSAVPQSRAGILPHERQPKTNDLVGWSDDTGAVTIEAPAGSIVVFSSLILHATGANRSTKLRRVYLAQYTAEAMLNPGTRELRNDAVPIVQRGEHATIA